MQSWRHHFRWVRQAAEHAFRSSEWLMVKLNVYQINYIRSNSEYKLDVVAPSPERAIEDARRYLEASYYSDIEIVEMSQVVKQAVFYKNPKPKKKRWTVKLK